MLLILNTVGPLRLLLLRCCCLEWADQPSPLPSLFLTGCATHDLNSTHLINVSSVFLAELSQGRKSLDLRGGTFYEGRYLFTYSGFKPTAALLTFQPKSQSKGSAVRWVTCEMGRAQPSDFQMRSLRVNKPFSEMKLLTK